MKRLLFFICTLLCANVLMAQTRFWIGDIQYEVTSTNPAKVKVNDANTDIATANIPTTVNYNGVNYSVTSIGERAFRDCSSLTSVTIPNSVTTIEDNAFSYCYDLTSVTIPNSVTSIGDYAFFNCRSLTSVDIPNSITSIGGHAFCQCYSLNSVTIPNSVTSIGTSAFSACTSLTSVTIPNSVTTIEDHAFSSCSSLTSVTIPNSVTSIGNIAFYNCSSLTSVTIGNSVTSIGYDAFGFCSSLTSVTIPNSVTSIGSSAFRFCSSLTSVILPNNANISSFAFESTGGINVDGIYYGGAETVNIGNYTFNNVGFITFYLNGNETTITPSEVSVIDCDESLSGDIVISSTLSYQGINYSVTSIGYAAFLDCSSLTSITIPNSVTSIGHWAFQYCSSLTSITIPNSVTYIGNYAFDRAGVDASVIIDSVTYKVFPATIPDSYYANLTDYSYPISGYRFITFHIGDSTYAPTEAFVYGCEQSRSGHVDILSSIEFAGNNYSVTSIGEAAFHECSSLTSITIPNSVTSIGNWAFQYCSSLTSITIPNSVTSIGTSAFYDCSSLTSVDIPNSVTSIGGYAFYNCSSLTSITIPNSVTSIGDSTFYNCSSLTSVTLPEHYTEIYYGAFDNVGTRVIIDSVTYSRPSASLMVGSNEFYVGFTTFYVGDNVYRNPVVNASVIDCDTSKSGEVVISSIEINDMEYPVTSIGEYAFENCNSLTSVTIPNSVTSIGNNAFDSCSALTSVSLDMSSIPANLFPQSTALQNLTFGENVASIASGAFSSYYFLQNVTCLATNPPTLADNTVFPYPNIATLTVPCGTLEDYSAPTSFWNMFFMGRISENGYDVVATANDNAFGSVAVENDCSTVTLTATANDCYQFVSWNDGNTDNPRTVALTSDTSFTAIFALIDESSLLEVETESISFFPNPTDSKITFSQKIEKIEVIDLTGKTIFTFTNAKTINIESLPSGAYYLRLTNEEKTTMQKVIKQ